VRCGENLPPAPILATEQPRPLTDAGSPDSAPLYGGPLIWSPGEETTTDKPGVATASTLPAQDRQATIAESAEDGRSREHRWRNTAFPLLAVVALSAGGGIAFVTLTSGDHARPTTTTARTAAAPTTAAGPLTSRVPPVATPETPPTIALSQATEMNAVLQAVQSTRSQVPDTLGSCDSVGSDLSVLQQVVQDRRDEVSRARSLQADQLTGDDDLRQDLVDLTQTTLDADEDYLNWAQQAEASGECTDVSENGAIGRANQRAADAKRHFVAMWNAIAPQFDLPTYVWNDF
jgi:hypothetical protein